jgi:glycerate kinase
MKFANAYRENARDCIALAGEAEDDLAEVYKRMADAWYVLATEQDVLDRVMGQAKEAPNLPDGTLD